MSVLVCFPLVLLLRRLHGLAMRLRISRKVLDHIVARHPEVKAYIDEVAETVRSPDLVVRGSRGELKALKFYQALHIDEKVIITAYFTSNVDRVKGEVVWRKRR